MKRKRNWEESFPRGKLKYRVFELHKTEEIAKYSFIVHKSINYLDLSLREFSALKEKRKVLVKIMFCIADPAYAKKFVSTVESCRKTLFFERRCLYTLHLDLPIGREEPFLSVATSHSSPFNQSKALCFNDELIVKDCNYQYLFSSFIEEALEQKSGDMDFVRRQIALVKRTLSVWKFEGQSTVDLILKCLFPDCTDSEIVREFLSMIDFNSWVLYHSKPKVLEYLLVHAHRSRYDLKLSDREGGSSVLVNKCFYASSFKCVEVLMKYQNAPFYYDCGTGVLYKSWKREPRDYQRPTTHRALYGIYSEWCMEDLDVPFENDLMSRRRYLLWLQVFHAYPARNVPPVNGRSATFTLRLLWRSLPDVFFTLEELTSAYRSIPGIIDTTTKVHEFYTEAMGEDLAVSGPRSLQQYCRVTIRKSLCYNLQLPFGIAKLNLPSKLEAFMKLQT